MKLKHAHNVHYLLALLRRVLVLLSMAHDDDDRWTQQNFMSQKDCGPTRRYTKRTRQSPGPAIAPLCRFFVEGTFLRLLVLVLA